MSGQKELNYGSRKSILRDKLGLTLAEYQECESGTRRFGAERLSKVAQLMDVPANYFFQLSPVSIMPRNRLVN
jgi:hypothetical protein